MENIIVIAVLVVIIGFATIYVYKAKKSGKKCIGCPDCCSCGSKQNGTSCNGCCGSSKIK